MAAPCLARIAGFLLLIPAGPGTAWAVVPTLKKSAGRPGGELGAYGWHSMTPGLLPAERPAPLTAAARKALEKQQHLAALPAMKISIGPGRDQDSHGWYRVTGAALVAAGADATLLSADPRMLQLFAGGYEQAIVVTGGNDGHLDAADTVEFYADGIDTPWTGERVYWLAVGAGPGKRVEPVAGTGHDASPGNFLSTVTRRDRSIYFAALLNGDLPNFFGATVGTTSAELALQVEQLAAGAGVAQLAVAMQGVSPGAHKVSVTINGNPLGTVRLADRGARQATLPVSTSALLNGTNKVVLRADGGATDVTLVDFVRLTYPHAYRAENGLLRFDAPADAVVTVDGFSANDARVFDVSEPGAVREARTKWTPVGQGYALTVQVPRAREAAPSDETRTLLAVAPARIREPLALTPNEPSRWQDTRGDASFIIIVHPDFRDELAPLVALRRKEGWTVAIVTVDDLFDEFTFGEKDPQAIRSFLAHTRRTWTRPPQAVLLVGDASFDPRGFLGKGSFDFVSTKLFDTDDLETSSDDWFVDFDGDAIPDIPIGRLPVRTAAEARAVIAKITAFEPGPVAALTGSTMVFAGDYDPDPALDFEAGIRTIRAGLPTELRVTEILRRTMGDVAAKRSIGEALTAAPFVLNYVGHGTVEMWGGTWITTAALTATPAAKPMALMLATTCLNGFFHDVYSRSVTEAMVTMPQGGALAAIGSSSLAELADQVVLSRELLRLALTEGRPLGQALQLAKKMIKDEEVQRSYMLFGDPTARLVVVPEKLAASVVYTDGASSRGDPPAGCAVGHGGRPVSTVLLCALLAGWSLRRRGSHDHRM